MMNDVETAPATQTKSAVPRRSGLSRWFSTVWLVWLVYPVISLLERPRGPLEYAVGFGALGVFVSVFLWAYFGGRHYADAKLEHPYRAPSLIGMAVSYATATILWPIMQGNSLGLLVYAGSFAGFQLSILPAAFSIGVSAVAALALAVWGDADASVIFIPVFTVVAAIGNHIAYREIVSSRQLRRSQEEVARIAKIAERERIARDLHDLLGHTLSVIVLKSELASKLAEKDPARATKEIREIERIARESLQEVRSAVRGYRSTGLEGELAGVSLACEAAQIKLETYITPLELEWAAEQTLAFVLREAVTNAIRHANAKNLWVSLERGGDSARLSIWDDGSGRIIVGNGVRGMRERLEFLGGTLEVNADHKGVTALLPLKHPDETQSLASGVGLEGAS